jgi:exonuclease III
MAERPSIVCLQETKLDVISDFNDMQILGLGFDYAYLPTIQTWGGGGIVLVWCIASEQ